MARGPLPLPVSLDPAASLPLHVQLREGLRAAILDRRLPHGTRLPASRVLAADLGCARGTVVLALEQLTAEGYLTARPGAATQVFVISATRRSRNARSNSPCAARRTRCGRRPERRRLARDASAS